MLYTEVSLDLKKLTTIYYLSLLSFFYSIWAAFALLLLIPVFGFFTGRLSLLFIALGFVSALALNQSINNNLNSSHSGLLISRVHKITVELSEDSFLSGNGKRIFRGNLVSVEGRNRIECDGSGAILVIGKDGENPFHWGEIISLSASLKEMHDSREFFFIAYAQSGVRSDGWISPVFLWRKGQIRKIENILDSLPDNVAALFNALYTGNSDHLDRDIKENFRKSGVPHLLALSGFHVSIIVLILTWFLQYLIGRTFSILLSIPFLLFYLFFAGPSPSLLRSVLMFTAGALFLLTWSEVNIVQLLLTTCILQLFLCPEQGLSLSFQLSYLALSGILVFGRKLNYYFQPFLPGFLRLSVCASLGAHIATAPLLIFKFGELYPVGIFSSLILTPLITLFMWLSLILFLAVCVGAPLFLQNFFNTICTCVLNITVDSVLWFSRFKSIRFSSAVDIIVYIIIQLIIVLSLNIQSWRFYGRRKSSQFKLRFTVGNKSTSGNYGTGSKKEMEPELSD